MEKYEDLECNQQIIEDSTENNGREPYNLEFPSVNEATWLRFNSVDCDVSVIGNLLFGVLEELKRRI